MEKSGNRHLVGKMGITYKQVADTINSGALSELVSKPLTWGLQLKLRPLREKLAKSYQFLSESEIEVLEKIGIKDTDKADADQKRQFLIAQQELLETESDIEVKKKIPFQSVENALKEATAALFVLDWLIEFPESADESRFDFGATEDIG